MATDLYLSVRVTGSIGATGGKRSDRVGKTAVWPLERVDVYASVQLANVDALRIDDKGLNAAFLWFELKFQTKILQIIRLSVCRVHHQGN